MKIQKLDVTRHVSERDVAIKLNEVIDEYNNHFHHANELQFGTHGPMQFKKIKSPPS